MEKAILFTNYSKEDFTHKYDGASWSFPEGQSMMLEGHLAMHFAKHLAVRELNREDKPTGRDMIALEMKKSLDAETIVEAENSAKLQAEVINYNSKKKAELVEIAEEKGIDVEGMKKSELVDELEGMNE